MERWIGLVVIGCLLMLATTVPAGVDATSPGPHETPGSFDITFAGPAVAVGAASGDCQSTGALIRSSHAPLIVHGEGQLAMHQTETARPVAMPGHPSAEARSEVATSHRVDRHPAEDGSWTIFGGNQTIIGIYPARVGTERGTTAVTFEGSNVSWGHPEVGRYGVPHWRPSHNVAQTTGSDAVALRDMGYFSGPTRALQLDQGQRVLSGAFTIIMHQAAVATPSGSRLSTGAATTEQYNSEAPPAATIAVREHRHGELVVQSASLTVPPSALVYCTEIGMALAGALTMYETDGQILAGEATRNETHRRVVTVLGEFDYRDRAAAHDPTIVHAEGRGNFSGAYIDFSSVGGAALSPLLRWAIPLLIVALGMGVRRILPVAFLAYSRLRQDRILDHPRRRIIMDAIGQHPGCNLTELVELTKLARGVVKHHVRHLVQQGLVRQRRVGADTLHIVAPATDEAFRRVLLERKPYLRSVYKQAQDRPLRAHAVRDLRDAHRVSDTAVRKWLTQAEQVGIVRLEGPDEGVRLAPCI